MVSENTISISRIISFASNQIFSYSPGNAAAAKEGQEIHREIEQMLTGGIVPPSLQKAGLTLPVQTELPVKEVITPGLTLSGRVDIISKELTVEMKTHQITGRDLMQAVLERMAAGGETEMAAVYLPKRRETYLIKDGGVGAEPALTTMAENLYQIDSNFREIKRIEQEEVKGSGKPDICFDLVAEMRGQAGIDYFNESAEWGTKKLILARTASKWTREFDMAKEEAMRAIRRQGNLVVFR